MELHGERWNARATPRVSCIENNHDPYLSLSLSVAVYRIPGELLSLAYLTSYFRLISFLNTLDMFIPNNSFAFAVVGNAIMWHKQGANTIKKGKPHKGRWVP